MKLFREDAHEQSLKPFKTLLSLSIATLRENTSWFGPLSAQQKFCWGMIATLCNRLNLTAKSFSWNFKPTVIITQLGFVFETYCKSRELSVQSCLLTEMMPQEVRDCPWEDVRSYFNWIQRLQNLLCSWQKKISSGNVNYDEVVMYNSSIESVSSIGKAVCATMYVMDMQNILDVKKNFTRCFEELSCYLLRYVPDHPEVKYCTLPELLFLYGVSFPPNLQEILQHKIIFPGDERKVPREQKFYDIISLSAKNAFKPGQNISLMLINSFTLCDIQEFLNDLQKYVEPITDHMEMLVFFYLHKSEMFSKHLSKRLDDIMSASSSETVYSHQPIIRPSLAQSKPDIRQIKAGIPIGVLQMALDGVRELLLKFINGTATYSEIVANGAVELEALNSEKEFTILKMFSNIQGICSDDFDGLGGVKSMLELFQLINHTGRIKELCKKYHLDQCLKDEKLKEIISITEELKMDNSHSQLTLNDAKVKTALIKNSFSQGQCDVYSCLKLFQAIADSDHFYKFITDKHFDGEKGQETFQEQYQLVTVQLQHEEYDENVLNHLRVAYEFITPFMARDITFSNLMGKVTKLDVTHGLKQLETVNKNITLIRLWFSRAEVSVWPYP